MSNQSGLLLHYLLPTYLRRNENSAISEGG